MSRCEDYPCCGHAPNECPRTLKNGRQVWTCVECGKRLPRDASSSICPRCMKRAIRRFDETGEMFPDERPY